MLSHEQDAEDCLQEAFLRAYRAYPRMHGEVNYRAWLYRIAGNTAKTQLGRRQRRDGRETELEPQVERKQAAQPPGAKPAEEALQRKQLWSEVRRAVQALPFKQQQSLLLRKYQGLSYAEIGQALECSPEAARANVYQALKRLRHGLAAEAAGRK